MISVDVDVRWIGEVKCRPWENIRKDEALRFLAYIVDYLSSEGPTAAALIAPNDPAAVQAIGQDTERVIEAHPTIRGQASPGQHDGVPP